MISLSVHQKTDSYLHKMKLPRTKEKNAKGLEGTGPGTHTGLV